MRYMLIVVFLVGSVYAADAQTPEEMQAVIDAAIARNAAKHTKDATQEAYDKAAARKKAAADAAAAADKKEAEVEAGKPTEQKLQEALKKYGFTWIKDTYFAYGDAQWDDAAGVYNSFIGRMLNLGTDTALAEFVLDLFDADGHLVGTTKFYVENLKRNDVRSFKGLWKGDRKTVKTYSIRYNKAI